MSTVSVTKEPKTFAKMTLTIEIETQEELDGLKGLFGCDFTVPDMLRGHKHIKPNEFQPLRDVFLAAYCRL